MNLQSFNEIIEEQLRICEKTLINKGVEYAADAALDDHESDRLEHFKRAAALQGVTMKQALLGMLTKHTVSVADMCSGGDYPIEKWREKITDSINYLLILKAIVMEEALNETNRSCGTQS